jgi:hypothetical protein
MAGRPKERKKDAKLPAVRVEPSHQKRVHSQWEAKVCLQGVSATIRRESGVEGHFSRNKGAYRQAVAGTGAVGRH